MIYSPFSVITRSSDKKLAAAASISSNGQALVYKVESGQQVVDVAAGAAGEVFAGFSNLQTSASAGTPTTAVKVQTLVIPVSGVVTVAKTPLASSTFASDVATGSAVAVVSVSGTSVDLGAANAGKTVSVVYRYTMTAAEARSLVGDVQPGGYSGNTYGQCGVAHEGVLYTTFFDTSKNFATATALKLASGGLITNQTGSGVSIDAVVVQVPTADYPFLGIQFRSI